MRTYAAAAAMAFVVALACVPLVAWLARRIGALSVPGQRDVHTKPIPRLGGVAITIATLSPILALFVIDSGVARWVREDWGLSAGLILGGLGLCGIGALDDTRPVRARYKLLAQILASLFAYQMGFRIDALTIPFLGSIDLGLLSLPLTLAWIIGVTNAVNLIDGLDGLAAGVVFFAATANFSVALVNDSVFVALIMACVSGALLGFLPYNFNPARIFMGDSGSYFLGFTLACSSLAGASQKATTTVALLVPILALGLPIFDTLVSMARRKLEGRSMFAPDRGHIHHRLVDKGLSHRKVVLILYTVSLILAVCAIVVSLGRNEQTGLALLLATGLMLGLVTFARSFSLSHLKETQAHELLCDLGQGVRESLLRLPVELHKAGHQGDVWRELESLARKLDVLSISLSLVDPNRDGFSWIASEAEGATLHRDEVRARLEVRAEGVHYGILELCWRDAAEKVNLQTEVLLQLVADQIGYVLARLEARRGALFEAAAALDPQVVEA